jgi:hypothetical protein
MTKRIANKCETTQDNESAGDRTGHGDENART